MDYKVSGIQGLKGAINAPPSKSYTHRAFVIASLAEGESRIENYLRAGDTLATVNACRALGVEINLGSYARVKGSGGELKTPSRAIDCENSGTTIRLVSGIASLDGVVTLIGDSSLQRRPMQPLLDALRQLGVKAYSSRGNGAPPIIVEGGNLRGGRAELRGDVSSQFISSLLIVSPYAEDNVEVALTTPLMSKPYIDITLDVMEGYGIGVVNRGYRSFENVAGRKYRGRKYKIEGDYTNASYFLALAALTDSDIAVNGLRRNSKQGDRAMLRILGKMGAKVEVWDDGARVKGKELRGIEVDLRDSPDLVPTVAALACKARGTTVIKNVEHARHKESDRLATCAREFRKFGAEIIEKWDGLVIKGTPKLKGALVESYGDHRLAMALSIMGLTADGTTAIKGAECAGISYPGFFEVLNSLI
ncbi:MAG: 3-phosphoshikimate 1-carboxyvinyltransferase [Candidatus Hydrothermarchaeota archaeon]|nr:3-phosphoshikimate 1-carboxyvinyltransferase [Candidatus Hydrothermarchaeota archaeon]